MADRRGDEPLPRRTLAGPSQEAAAKNEKRPISERVSSAVSAAGTAVQAATSRQSGGASATTARPGTGAPADRGPGAGSPRPATRGSGRSRKGSRRARLRLVHLDPWSVMKTSFLLSVAFGIVTVVAVAVVWSVLDAAGVWDSINSTVSDVVGGETASTFDVKDYVGTSRVLGFTMVVAVVDVVLITAIATLSAFLYNLSAALLGGVEVTLAEDER
jgi:hypothetical protein